MAHRFFVLPAVPFLALLLGLFEALFFTVFLLADADDFLADVFARELTEDFLLDAELFFLEEDTAAFFTDDFELLADSVEADALRLAPRTTRVWPANSRLPRRPFRLLSRASVSP